MCIRYLGWIVFFPTKNDSCHGNPFGSSTCLIRNHCNSIRYSNSIIHLHSSIFLIKIMNTRSSIAFTQLRRLDWKTNKLQKKRAMHQIQCVRAQSVHFILYSNQRMLIIVFKFVLNLLHGRCSQHSTANFSQAKKTTITHSSSDQAYISICGEFKLISRFVE